MLLAEKVDRRPCGPSTGSVRADEGAARASTGRGTRRWRRCSGGCGRTGTRRWRFRCPPRRRHRPPRQARRHRPIVTVTGPSTRRTAHPPTRRSGPASRTCPTSRSSTRTVTGSTATRRTRSSSPRNGKRRRFGDEGGPNGRSRRGRSRRSHGTLTCYAAAGRLRSCRRGAPVSGSTAASTPPAGRSDARRSSPRIVGAPEGVFASSVTGVELQYAERAR